MSAPSILAKNLRTVGKSLIWASRQGLNAWDYLIRSPYRRLILGATVAVLPISVSIAAFSLSPGDVEHELRKKQRMIETTLPMPAIAEQINVVTSAAVASTQTTDIRRHDTLMSIFARLNIQDGAMQRFVRQQPLASALVSARENVHVQAKVTTDKKALSLKIFLEKRRSHEENTVVTIQRHSNGFSINEAPFEYEVQHGMAAATIHTDLDATIAEHGVPEKVAQQIPLAFERYFSHGNKLGQGDSFRLIYERLFLDGEFVRNGKILAISITHNDKILESFWADDGTRRGGYYKLDGSTNQLAFIRVPVEGARVTSAFMPMRRHPVTGVLRPHQGTDFGAPRGNKIFAAADGVVIRRRFDHDGFGHYLMIQHDDSRVTLYAHMSRIQKHVVYGTRVTKGEVIGFVGTTGLSTGPHLHYELRLNNRQVNPMKVNFPDKDELTVDELEDLLSRAHPLTARLALLDQVQSTKLTKTQTQEADLTAAISAKP